MPSIERLEALLSRQPDDVFLNYGLAMALRSAGRPLEARERFDRALRLDPGYVPAYFQKALLLVAADSPDEARVVLGEGIRRAEAAGDAHAAGEMGELLASIG